MHLYCFFSVNPDTDQYLPHFASTDEKKVKEVFYENKNAYMKNVLKSKYQIGEVVKVWEKFVGYIVNILPHLTEHFQYEIRTLDGNWNGCTKYFIESEIEKLPPSYETK